MLAAQPCLAAEDPRDLGLREQHASAFAGVNLRVPLGDPKRAKPSARLQFTAASTVRDWRTGSTRTVRAHGFEIGTGRGRKPALYMGGHSTDELKTRLGVGASTTTTIVVAGVVVLALVVLAASKVPPQPDYDD